MLYLFGPKETDFVNGDSDLIHHTYDEVVDRSKGFYLKFKIALDKDERYKDIKKEMIISAYTPDGWNQFRVFDIYNYSNHVEVVATQLHYDLNYKKVFPFVVNRATAQIALNVFVKNFKSDLPNFKFTSNITDLHNFSTDDDLERLEEGHNALEILNRIAARWGGELKVDGYNVQLVKKLGKFTNALLYEHKNISEFVDETSISEIVTRIHAVSRFRPEREEGSTEEPEEVTIKVVVDSPLINEYAQVYEEDYTNNDARTKDQLISWARLKYSTDNIDKPARSIKVETNIIDGQEINYGDDLVLKYTKHDVDEIIRCVGYQYNPNSKQYISVTLGSNMNSLSSTITGAVHDSTKNQLSNIEKQVQIIKYAANNVNRVTTGPLPIPDPIEGDMWYYHPDGRPNEVELRIFQNGGWVTIVSDMTGENVRRAIADLELEAEELDNSIKASDQKANEAKETAGLAKSAVDAFGIITKETVDKMVDVEQIAADALADASVARTQAGQAVADALAAVDDARIAMDDAQSALSKASGVESSVSTLSKEVDTVAGKVALKAEQTEVDTIKGTVDTHTTKISQNATAISSKAEQTEVDTVKGTVATHTSTLSQQAKDISARLTQSQVNSLVDGKGYSTVSYVDTEISATAGAIRTEMTAVEGKIDGLQVGGRNLLPQSGNFTYTPNSFWVANGGGLTYDSSSQYNGFGTIKTEIGRGIVGKWLKLENGVDYTYSMTFKADKAFTGDHRVPLHYHAGKNLTNEGKIHVFEYSNTSYSESDVGSYKKIWIKFRLTEDADSWRPFVYGYSSMDTTFNIANIQLEKGNTVTDWTPAPEDMLGQNDFTVYKNTIESSISGITTELSKTAKTTDLQGMVTETYLATKQYTKQGEINTQLQSYLKTTDLDGKIQTTSSFQNVKATTDRFTRVIGSTDAEAKSNIAQIAMTDRSFQTTVRESIDADSNNMIKNGNFENGTESWSVINSAGSVTRKSNHGKTGMHLYGAPTAKYQGIAQLINPLSLEKGSKVTVGFDATRDSIGGDLLIIVHFMVDGAISDQGAHVFNTDNFTSKSYQRESVTLNVPIKCNSIRVMLYMNDVGKHHNIYVTDITVSRGNIDLGYSPHVTDKASTKTVSDIKQTADSIQALVGTTNDSVARAVMTSNLWETEVSKVIDDELEQGYKTVTSKVNVVDGGKGNNSGSEYSGGKYFYLLNKDGVVQNVLSRNKTYTLEFITQTFDNKGNLVILDVKNRGSTEWEMIYYGNMTSGKQVSTFTFNNTVFASSVADYRLTIKTVNNISVPYLWGFRLYEEVEIEIPTTSTNTGAISSKITQLYDMINLSVLGQEGAMSRIAMGEEGIQIDGKLLHITAKTFIDNAVIKSAMIDTLDASKITTGELNAKNVRVINLDANSISGNEASFIRAMFTARHSALQITGNGITVSKSNGNRTFEVDSDGVNFYSDTGPGAYISTNDIITWNGTSWVDSGVNSVTFASELNHSIGIGYKIYSNGRYVTREAIRLERTGSGTPELQLNLPVKNLIFSRGRVGGADGSYLRNTQNTAGIWMGDNGLVYLMESGSLYGSGWWKNK